VLSVSLHRVRSCSAVVFLVAEWICCEAGVRVSVASYRPPACGVGGGGGRAPRALQCGVAGAQGSLVARQQDADQVWGSVGAADWDASGAPGSSGVVVF